MFGPFDLVGHLFWLLVVGGLAAWVAGLFLGWRHGVILNVAVGLFGLWIGSHLAALVNVMDLGVVGQFVLALIGSAILVAIWRAAEDRVVAHI